MLRHHHLVWIAFAAASIASCANFKTAGDEGGDGGGDGGAAGDGASSSGGDGGTAARDAARSDTGTSPLPDSGPGRWGALPYGYCCATDNDCRSRNCLTVGSTKMCGDICRSNDSCVGGLAGFTCVGVTASVDGHCEPIQPAACTPADSFVHGTKKLGACCTPTHDGANGQECEGGHCDSFGNVNNPYVCTNVCTKGSDCPGNFLCASVSTGYSICAELADPFTCTP